MDNKDTNSKFAELVANIKQEYDGVVPIQECQNLMDSLDAEGLKKLVILACNQIGVALNGGDYPDAGSGVWYLNEGANRVLKAYEATNSGISAPAVGHA